MNKNQTLKIDHPASVSRFGDRIRQFMKLEASGGLILMLAACLAMGLNEAPGRR